MKRLSLHQISAKDNFFIMIILIKRYLIGSVRMFNGTDIPIFVVGCRIRSYDICLLKENP
jgi:hypothetical protein